MKGFRLEINIGTKNAPDWQGAVLADNASIHWERCSSLWNEAASYSYEFDFPIEPNRHIVGNADEIYGRSLYKALYRKPARLWVQGVVFAQGTIDMDDEVEVSKGSVAISLVSGNKLLKDMLEGVSAQDVQLFWGNMNPRKRYDGSDCAYGEESNRDKIEREHPGKDIQNIRMGWCNGETANTWLDVAWMPTPSFYGDGSFEKHAGTDYGDYGPYHTYCAQRPYNEIQVTYADGGFGLQSNGVYRVWYDYGDRRFLYGRGYYGITFPVDVPIIHKWVPFTGIPANQYAHRSNPTHRYDHTDRYKYPYCNITACSQKYEKDPTDATGRSWIAKRGYNVWSPDAYNSGPCFFVMFWLDQLFDVFLDVNTDFASLYNEYDINALCFINHKCKFKTTGQSVARADYGNMGVGNSLVAVDGQVGEGGLLELIPNKALPLHTQGDSKNISFSNVLPHDQCSPFSNPIDWPSIGSETKVFDHIPTHVYRQEKKWLQDTQYYEAYATSENLPDADAQTILESLENAFGFKFMYDEETRSVQTAFYRDILRSEYIETLQCVVSDAYKKEERTTGFRLKYSSSSEAKKNTFTKREELVKGSEDTTYNYNDYRNISVIQGEGKKDYVQMIAGGLSPYDETCYISAKTGNAYRIKVDQSATNEAEWYPSLFEVGGYRDVEYGDCGEDSQVDEKVISFNPVIPNMTNYESIKGSGTDARAIERKLSPAYAIFADGEFHTSAYQGQLSLLKYIGQSALSAKFASCMQDRVAENLSGFLDGCVVRVPALGSQGENHERLIQYNLELTLERGWSDAAESNGNPWNTIDSGLTLGILRNPSDISNDVIMDNYDAQGNAAWVKIAHTGKGVVTSDSVDEFGQWVDYGNATLTPDMAKQKLIASYGMSPDVRFDSGRSDDNTLSVLHEKCYWDTTRLSPRPFITITIEYNGVKWLVSPYTFKSIYLTESRLMDELKTYWDKAVASLGEDADLKSIAAQVKQQDDAKYRFIGAYCTGSDSELSVFNMCVELLITGKVQSVVTSWYRPLSLKLKAEKPQKADDGRVADEKPYVEVPADSEDYDRIIGGKKMKIDYELGVPLYHSVDDGCARRGLFDRFWLDYAYFVVNRKTVVITIPRGGVELLALVNLDMTRRYRVGNYVGWINKYSCEIDEKGVGDVVIELYYL